MFSVKYEFTGVWPYTAAVKLNIPTALAPLWNSTILAGSTDKWHDLSYYSEYVWYFSWSHNLMTAFRTMLFRRLR